MIKLELIKSLTLQKDIYRVKLINNKIVANNNYRGLLFLNKNLELQKKIAFRKKNVLINQIFSHENWLLLDSTEDDFLLLVDQQRNNSFIIPLTAILTPLYYYKD